MNRVKWRCGWILVAGGCWAAAAATVAGGENWLQSKGDARHSGDVPRRSIHTPLGLAAAIPLTDAIFTAPVVADGRVYAVDGSGTAFAIDARTFQVLWTYATGGGAANCNNVSSPALVDGRLHFGTMAGGYYVLDAATGRLVREIACGEPIFSAPVVSRGRVYFATLGSRVYALEPDGRICWTWDFVREVLKFPGDRWSGQDWLRHKGGRVTWRDQFCCPIDLAHDGQRLVVPAGGRILWLKDGGSAAELEATGVIPAYHGDEYPGLFGLSIGDAGAVYVQWHRRDNSGRVEIFRLRDGKVSTDYVHGTETAINLPGLLSFSSVSLRGADVYRCRPEDGLAFSKHAPQKQPQSLGGLPAVAPPILLGDVGLYGSLDGKLCVARLDGSGAKSVFATPWGRAITAPAAVCDGRIYFGCEDGYLYVLAPGGKAPLPTVDLGLQRVRSPLSGPRAGPQFDWFTNYGNLANTNANRQGLTLPLRMKWIRRYEGTFKHLPVCGGGRLYIHTAEGQIIAVEQETGRLLWRQYFPNVYLSFTAPLYVAERLLVPQAGMKQCRVRCLDAATGRLRWEAPFSGSPSWSRQAPPVVYKNLAIYAFGSGRYAPQGSAKPFVMQEAPQPAADNAEVMSWIYGHDNPYYPRDNRPLLRAWEIDTGREAWSKDFSSFGCGGNDCGLCVLDGTLYYSTFFGYDAGRKGADRPRGLTAAVDPLSGHLRWSTTKYYVTAGCTISARDGRLYLGGYNKPGPQTRNRYVWCLDARDGSLVWQSEPVASAVNVVSIGPQFIFSNASGRDGHVLDRATGKILSRFNYGYACTRFTLSEPYVLGPNMDLVDLAGGNRLASSGPPLEGRECVGSIVSNGRLYYTAQASGLQVCLVGSERGAEEK